MNSLDWLIMGMIGSLLALMIVAVWDGRRNE